MAGTEGYLLDTNIVSAWLLPKREGHVHVVDRVASAAKTQSPLIVSSVTLGEIEYGHLAESPGGPTEVQRHFNSSIIRAFPAGPYRLPVSEHTAAYYGAVRAQVFRTYSPRDGRKARRLHQLELPDDVECYGQRIQENDIWIASQAIERNLILVSHDKLTVISGCAAACGFALRIEDWCEPMAT